MSVFQRVIRGAEERERHEETPEVGRARLFERADGNGNGSGMSAAGIDVEEFEYVRVQDTALARLAGTGWGEMWKETPEVTLVASLNGAREEFAALPAATHAGTSFSDARAWRVAFSLDVALVESPETIFTLLSPAGTTLLPSPTLREVGGPPLRPVEPTSEVAEREIEEARRVVREADAGRQWIQAQLSRERDRRRELEEAVRRAEAETAKLKSIEAAVPRIELERERREELERQVEDLTAEVEELSVLRMVRRQLEEEKERTQALEGEIAQLAIDRERLSVLDERVSDAARQLAAARAEGSSAAAEREALRNELQHARGEADATIARLRAELEAVRALQAEDEAVEEAPVVEDLSGEVARLEEELAGERERTRALEGQIAELAVASERVGALERQVNELEAAAAAQQEAPASEPEVEVAVEAEATGPPEQPVTTTGSVPCTACDATGSCSKCGGKGKRLGMRCADCGGSGLCHTCGGPGFVWQ